MPDQEPGQRVQAPATARAQSVRAATQGALLDPELQAQLDATVAGLQGTAPAEAKTGQSPEAASPAAGTTSVEPAATAVVATPGQEDVPTSYFGEDFSDLPPEARARVIARLTETDKFVDRLMKQRASENQQVAQQQAQPQAAPAAPAELTDAEILQRAGLREDDPYYEVKAPLLITLERRDMQYRKQLEDIQQSVAVDQTVRFWNDTLDKLEKDFGALPLSREDLFEYAAKSGIADPESAFWRVSGPARRDVATEVAKERMEAVRAMKIQQGAGIRPTTAQPTTTKALEAKTVRAAVKEAAQQAADEMGISWEQALQR